MTWKILVAHGGGGGEINLTKNAFITQLSLFVIADTRNVYAISVTTEKFVRCCVKNAGFRLLSTRVDKN